MLKNYNYVLTILLYPFILLLELLVFNGFLKNSLYSYLIIVMLIIFIPSFIMSLYCSIEEILKSKKKWRIVLLIFLPFFYLPIYYTKYVVQEEKYLGFIICFFGIILSFFTYKVFNNKMISLLSEVYRNRVVINDRFIYTSKNNLFSINISKDFRCSDSDIGDYVISCERVDDDSFIGVYSYDVSDYDEEEISDILEFHLNQSLEYIKESGYDNEVNEQDELIEVDYNNMAILLTQCNYIVDDYRYSLIIIKEMPKESLDREEFQKMIETIVFLNYNEKESS